MKPIKQKPVADTAQGYAIGITIYINKDGDMGLFENGLRQNVIFLYHMFKSSPACRRVFLLNHGDGEPSAIPPSLGIDPADLVQTADVIDTLDYVIGAGAAMDRQTVEALRARGVTIIAYKGGNGAIISIEAVCAKPARADAERYFDHDYYDAIWMTPQHIHSYRGWCEMIYRCPVDEVPQIWSPMFIDQRPDDIRARFGYKPGSSQWRVGVLDPNITVMKTSHIPMLVCEAAFRITPDDFSAFYITNGWPHREDPHFQGFFGALNATKAGKMTLEPRFVSADMLTNHCDAVVTHQWENGLNYLYYEVLAGGYPLIHNSPFLKDYGYYYPDFDPERGGDMLRAARRGHDARLDQYRRHSNQLIEQLAPANPKNILYHETLLASARRGA